MHLDETLRKLSVILFHFALIIIPLTFTVVNDELFEFNKLLLVYGLAIAQLGIWASRSLLHKRLLLPSTPFDLGIILFLVSQILSTLFSMHPRTSLLGYYSRFHGGLLSWFSYITLYYAFILNVRKEEVRPLMTSLLTGGVLSALYAIPEHFGSSFSCAILGSGFTTDCWSESTNPRYRIFGTFGQPNWLAAYMGMLIPISLSFIAVSANRLKRIAHLAIPAVLMILFSVTLLYTKSRSGVAAAGIALGIVVLGTGIRILREKNTSWLALGVPVGSLLGLCSLMLILGSPLNDKLFFFLPQSQEASVPVTPGAGTQLEVGGSESGDIRRVVWQGAVRVWQRYPLLGSGVETFAYSYFRDRPTEHNLLSEWDFLYNKAHNEFLNFLATTGIVGFLAYLLFYGSLTFLPFLWSLGNPPRSLSAVRSLFPPKGNTPAGASTLQFSLLVASALAGLAVSNFFGFSTVMVTVLTVILPAMVVVLLYPPFSGQPRRVSTSTKWILGGIALLTFYGLFRVHLLWRADASFAAGKQAMQANHVQTGFTKLQEAVLMLPDEPTYRDDVAYAAARIAAAYASAGQATQAAQFAAFAEAQSAETIRQNPVHINFYKTQTRLYLLLAQFDPTYADKAKDSLVHSRTLSPTDPKLPLYLALIAEMQGDFPTYERYLQETLSLRPIDEQARYLLGNYYETQGKYPEALTQYKAVIQSINPTNTLVLERIASISAATKAAQKR